MERAGGARGKTNANAAVRHDKILEVGKDTASGNAHPRSGGEALSLQHGAPT